ncbi:MAG: hypothetical protein ACTSRZ_11665 [Promethearchaeota archaeon]
MVELIWTFDYIKVDKKLEVATSRVYKNGEYIGEVDAREKLMLLSYLALFPGKDIIQIKLGTSQNSLYTILYFTKKYKEKGLIGCFSFSEFNTNTPFIWGKEYKIMEEVFDKFYETFSNLFSSSEGYTLDALNNYFKWMDEIIKDYYERWLVAKNKFYSKKEQLIRHELAETFSKLSESKPLIEVKKPKKTTIKLSAAEIKKKTISNNTNNLNHRKVKLQDLYDLDIAEIESIIGEFLNIGKIGEFSPEKYEQIWELQLINSYGNPLTRIVRFSNGEYIEKVFDNEFVKQGLEAMSYSVLRSIVEQKNLDIQYIKSSLGNGVEYIFFQTIKFRNNLLMLIMRCASLNKETNEFEDILIGGERKVLERISFEIKDKYADWFENNEYSSAYKNGPEEIVSIFYRQCRKFFKDLVNLTKE